MQQGLQFCNVNHAMVVLDPWFLPIIKMNMKEISLGKSALAISISVSNKTWTAIYVHEVTRCEVSITLLDFKHNMSNLLIKWKGGMEVLFLL